MKFLNSAPVRNAALAGSAIIIATWSYGWRGLVFALTLIVFWTVLQLRRATRLMQQMANRPKGRTDSIDRVLAGLKPGMSMDELLPLTASLGDRVDERGDWRWQDNDGRVIVVTMRRDVVVRWAVGEVGSAGTTTAGTPED
ncbi:hypothetical protein C7444_106174 [Sphaerotilus hippei]|uniref:Uncharacterized protein n=1 Tax=Sphaerotilus hippei TaxID=744406 RepID=A0A318H0Z2_9BURK|nr:hypothetical protein [Sphaerotilus hippei]PXW96653.1 hypothetical protein C7444_106174 [Sphaerotilus hippei]